MNNALDISKDEVIQIYQGQGPLNECSLPFISHREAQIKQKFSELGYFKKVSRVDQSLIYLKCIKLNHLEIVKTLGTWAFVGGVVGGVAGVAGHAPGIVGGAAIGVGAGTAAGALWCYHKGMYSKEEHIISVVKDSTEYSLFKKQRTQEQYELFVAFFKNYGAHLDEKYQPRISDFVCNITYDVPEYPVFSPYDVERKTPYEKEAIEAYLEKMKGIVEPQIEEYKERCAKLGISPDDKEMYEIRRQYCPLRTGYYTKEELIYDPDFCKSVISTLRTIQQDLKRSLPKDQDPIILKGVNALVDHYTAHYTQVNDELIKLLAKDIFSIDGDITLANQASQQMSKLLNKV